ncbi:MAG: hypothetical protein LAT80_08285 [Balneolaceae bacterium]|nr:hypothetical protein [Balneolaceae bacterium]
MIWMIKSTLCMGLLLLVYHLFFEQEKMYRFNRAYLLGGIFFSLTIPLIPVGMTEYLLSFSSTGSSTVSGSGSSTLNSVAVSAGGSEVSASFLDRFSWIHAAIFIWGVGSLLFLYRLFYKIDSILFKVRRCRQLFYRGSTVVLLPEKTAPFSFLNYIFLSEWEYKKSNVPKEVLIHEDAHVSQKHSYDIILVELIRALLWFNPLLIWYRRAIQLNHEFLADDAVLKSTSRVSSYQKLLFNTLTENRFTVPASHFNYSMTKKRIIMMTQFSSPIETWLKKLSALLLIAGAGFLFGTSATAHGEEPEKRVTIEITDSEILKFNGHEIHISLLSGQLAGLENISDYIVQLEVDENAEFGHVVDVQKMLREHLLLRISYSTSQNLDVEEKVLKLPPPPPSTRQNSVSDGDH